MNNHNILAIDLAKDVFQVCKTNSQAKVLFNREYSRQKLQELLITEKESLVAMESCCSAHYWSRFAMKYGHQVKMMDARSVKAFQTKQKTDRNDALAIAIAATQTHIHSIKVHTIDEQAMQSLERSRRLALEQQVAQSNHIRSILSEFGFTVPQGVNSLRSRLPYLLEDAENGLPFSIRRSLKTLWEHLLIQLAHVEELDEQLQGMIKTHPTCQKLIKLEGVGPLGALGL
ncbi:IS110 family transposase, partial [Vibrio cholerae]